MVTVAMTPKKEERLTYQVKHNIAFDLIDFLGGASVQDSTKHVERYKKVLRNDGICEEDIREIIYIATINQEMP